jgi:transposase-like protein
MKNKYISRSKISETKFRQIVKLFALDLTATQITAIVGLNPKTVDLLISKIRARILLMSRSDDATTGVYEADESYFGPRRVKGKRGRGAGSKTIVFGLYKRNGKVYTKIVPDAKARTLQAIIRGQVDVNSVIHTDGWPGYDGLVDVGYEKHLRLNHCDNEWSDRNGNHINGIESFWGYAKHRLTKFKGILNCKFELHLKETEFRFNHRGQDIYHILLNEFRSLPL